MSAELKATVTYTGDGSQLTYSFNFDYLKKMFVKVALVDGTKLTYGVDYNVSSKQITFLTAPTGIFNIYRETASEQIVSWVDASILKAADMNISQVQQTHIIEESSDAMQLQSIGIDNNNLQWQGRFLRLTNVADPVDSQDVVTKNYIESVRAAFINAMTTTKDSCILALETVRDACVVTLNGIKADVTTLKDTATTQATTATNKAGEAATSALIATNRAADATAQVGIATTKAGEAATSASTATAKAGEASTSAGTASTKATDASGSAAAAAAQAAIATNKAVAADASATIAFNKANEAGTSAATATTKAGEATTEASRAKTEADRAETAADTVDMSNYYNKTEVDAKDLASFPSGGIIMWSGAKINIPTSWYLCDGLNGTPNLQNRFVVGAGSSYAVGATGGEASHILTTAEMPSHNHSGSADTQGVHTHTVGMSVQSETGATSGTAVYTGGSITTSSNGAHSHNITVGYNGSGSAHNNLPPYYALCYIMKS